MMWKGYQAFVVLGNGWLGMLKPPYWDDVSCSSPKVVLLGAREESREGWHRTDGVSKVGE